MNTETTTTPTLTQVILLLIATTTDPTNLPTPKLPRCRMNSSDSLALLREWEMRNKMTSLNNKHQF